LITNQHEIARRIIRCSLTCIGTVNKISFFQFFFLTRCKLDSNRVDTKLVLIPWYIGMRVRL
jgi:hypothetical protein